MNMKKIAAACALAVGVCSVHLVRAADAQLISNGGVWAWATPDLWVDGYVPGTDASDRVSLMPADEVVKDLTLRLPAAATSFDCIWTNPPNSFLVWNTDNVRVGVRQLEGFRSRYPLCFQNSPSATAYNWANAGNLSGFDFTGTAAGPTIVNSLHLGVMPVLGVPDAGGAAEVRELMHRGMFVKDGAGDLVVDDVVHHDAGAFLEGGTLTLKAQTPTEAQPAPHAFFRLDSSDVLTVTEGGRSFVTNWPDATGNGFYAKENMSASFGPVTGTTEKIPPGRPWISEKKANGRTLVDFGAYRFFNTAQDPDAPSGMLDVSANAANLRECFAVIEFHSQVDHKAAPLFGNSSDMQAAFSVESNTVFAVAQSLGTRVWINGEPLAVSYDNRNPHRLHVLSFASPEDFAMNCLGRYGAAVNGGRGGFLVGEIIAYTNELTTAERRATVAYLKRKWLDAETYKAERLEWELGTVSAGEGAAIKVGAGDSVRVRTIEASAAAPVVKTGLGALAVESILPAEAAVVVAGGSLKVLNDLGTVADTALPAGAAVHFDATDADAFTYAPDSTTDVTAWCDETGRFVATNYIAYRSLAAGCAVRVKDASPTGLTALDFPTAKIDAAAPRMQFADSAEVRVCEGFIVWKNTIGGKSAPMHFGYAGKDLPFADRSKDCLLKTVGGGFGFVGGGVWTVNGLCCNPFTTAFGDLGGETDWKVIHFSTDLPVPLNAFAVINRGSTGGGCMVGEMVGYAQPLSVTERLAAEAYLMKRWLGETHPANETWRGPLAFTEGASAVIDTEKDLAPASVTVGSGTLVKRGSASVTIGNVQDDLSTISVEGGALVARLPILKTAVYHFDAADEETLVKDSSGNISTWLDVRRNGKRAAADLQHCMTGPAYRISDGSDGLLEGSPYIDLGEPCGNLGKMPIKYLATNETSASLMLSEACSSVREVHLVWNDHGYDKIATKYGTPLGNTQTTTSQSGFIRSSKYIQSTSYNLKTDIFIDGSETSYPQSTNKGDSFQVITLVVTGPGNFDADAGILTAFANDRNLVVGGIRLAEVIVFDEVQTVERRKAIDAYLLKKWCGVGTGAKWTQVDVSLSSGTSMKFNGVEPKIGLLSGSGTLLSSEPVIDELALVAASSTQAGLTVSGALALPRNATVKVTVPAADLRSVGRIPLISAGSLSDVDNVDSWVLNARSIAPSKLKLQVEGNTVYLDYVSPGLMLIFR